jgi:hypothetical protein
MEHVAHDRAAKIRLGVRRAKAAGKPVGINGRRLAAQHKAAAIERTAALIDVVVEFRANGLSYRRMVAVLNARGVPTPSRTGHWHVRTLQRLVSRAAAAEALLASRDPQQSAADPRSRAPADDPPSTPPPGQSRT